MLHGNLDVSLHVAVMNTVGDPRVARFGDGELCLDSFDQVDLYQSVAPYLYASATDFPIPH